MNGPRAEDTATQLEALREALTATEGPREAQPSGLVSFCAERCPSGGK